MRTSSWSSGTLLDNGRVMFPTAVILAIIDATGKRREWQHWDGTHGRVAGRVDPYTVALRRGATYVLRVSLREYGSLDRRHSGLKLPSGSYRIGAVFVGKTAQHPNSDMQGISLLNFWTGRIASELLDVSLQ
jgi:hypothetical protein